MVFPFKTSIFKQSDLTHRYILYCHSLMNYIIILNSHLNKMTKQSNTNAHKFKIRVSHYFYHILIEVSIFCDTFPFYFFVAFHQSVSTYVCIRFIFLHSQNWYKQKIININHLDLVLLQFMLKYNNFLL